MNSEISARDKAEYEFADYTEKVIDRTIRDELRKVKIKKDVILDERKYFIDFFSELKEDERNDLLEFEDFDTKTYVYEMEYLARLAKQKKDPYFAGFRFCADDDPDDILDCRLSVQTLRDPDTGEIITFDWRAPIASLYYESDPGQASFESPNGTISGVLSDKKRYVFKNGVLKKFRYITAPSDDEMLVEALSRNASPHMRAIIETLQKEQYRIVREHIDGITVISGCAGSGKTSVALHKAAYILYGFKDRMKESGIAVISPNNAFTEYISTVLPDLGEDKINSLLPEDILEDSLTGIEGYSYLNRLDEAEFIGEYGLADNSGVTDSESKAMMLCRKEKYKDDFRLLIKEYVRYLRDNIFKPELLYLTPGFDASVEPDEIKDMFYNIFCDTPVFRRTEEMTKYLCTRYDLREEENRNFIKASLDEMMSGLNARELYGKMLYDEDFISYVKGKFDLSFDCLKLYENLFEDGCAAAILNLEIGDPDIKSDVFFLISDEAQDFSPIFLELLRARYHGCNMMFVGDSDQVVFENTGDFVENIKKIIPRRPFRRYTLSTNYRSTEEIISYAAEIIDRDPTEFGSVRNGRPVESIEVRENNTSDEITKIASEMAESGLESLLVLTQTRQEAEKLKKITDIPLSLEKKINIIFSPVYLAKGLEADGVIVYDRNSMYYSKPNGRYTLYTACTRALHRLVIMNIIKD